MHVYVEERSGRDDNDRFGPNIFSQQSMKSCFDFQKAGKRHATSMNEDFES